MKQSVEMIEMLPLSAQEHFQRLGERLRQSRIAHSISQEEMATRMSTTRQTVARLERGDPSVSSYMLLQALYLLGMISQLEEVGLDERVLVSPSRKRAAS